MNPGPPNLGGDNEKKQDGPNLGGGPSLGGSPEKGTGGPNLGGAPDSGGSPNLGVATPNLGGGPKLGGTPSLGSAQTTTQVEKNPPAKPKSKLKRSSTTLYFSQFVRKWGVQKRKIRRAFIDLMMGEMRVKLNIATTNVLLKSQVTQLMNGQIEWLDETITGVKKGKDKLGKKLRKKDKKARASTLVFERLRETIKEERDIMNLENEQIMAYIEEELKKHQDTRMEPRACFWTLILSGLMLHDINERVEEEFEILMRVALEYDNPYKHTLMLFLYFVYYLIEQIPPFPKEDNQTNMVINVKETGYSMAHWIKYRYGTSSQAYMEYDRFLSYYARSFGLIRGRAPQYKRKAYFDWIDRTFVALENTFLKADLYKNLALGQTIEGVIAGVTKQLEAELEKKKYDEEGKLLNQPLEGEGALKFLNWLLEAALNRRKTPNIAMQPENRLDMSMFEFIPYTIKWENELGERLVVDWLGLDEEDPDEDLEGFMGSGEVLE